MCFILYKYIHGSKVFPHYKDISLYILYKTTYFQNILLVIPYPIFMKFSVLNTEINIGSSFYNFNIFHDQKYIMDDTRLKCGANSLHQFPVIKHPYFFPIIFILKIRRFPSFFYFICIFKK